ncbi:hypothetical protein QGN29_09850 [Temperatibacter marinus]|uniref:Uncharacterized protein n=1 Tax=Temperatibacter marinus TaxID=1456591 RepID=A0AA52H9Q5_9PROT|nr:hypothetical protein [Temperatibacter marinus]WND01853.1 hypothetical protein QGN29_09850 [Temperatibacter marinus]
MLEKDEQIFKNLYGSPKFIDIEECPKEITCLLEKFSPLYKEGKLPQRKDFDPKDFKKILPNLMLIDLIFEKDIVVDTLVKYEGSELDWVYTPHSQKLISKIPDKEVMERHLFMVNCAVMARKPITYSVDILNRKHTFWGGNFALVPFSETQQQITQILGIYVKKEGATPSLAKMA